MRPCLPPIRNAKTPHPCRLQVWLANPADYFGRFPEADLLVSSDALDTQLEPGDTGLELPHAAYTAMNIGAPSRSPPAPMLYACPSLAPALHLTWPSWRGLHGMLSARNDL